MQINMQDITSVYITTKKETTTEIEIDPDVVIAILQAMGYKGEPNYSHWFSCTITFTEEET